MDYIKWIRENIAHPRVAIYLKVVAVFIFLGALSHLGSILNLLGRPSWGTQPLYFQVLDVTLLLVNLVLAWGLWQTRFWAVVGWVAAVVLLQCVPFLFFTDLFASSVRERAMLYSMLVTHAVILGAFLLLLPRRKAVADLPDRT
ncbi:hypothetical protein ACFL3X_01065 [Gemmatimonadota bacterium]